MLQLTVLVWGFTAVVGKLITIPAASLVWYRQLLVVLILSGVFLAKRRRIAIAPRQAAQLAGIGLLISAHWVTFYACVHLATASLAALCIATVPLLTSVIEPMVFRRPMRPREAIFGIIVVGAVAQLVRATPQIFGASGWMSFAVGMVAALLGGIFGTLNGAFIRKSDMDPLVMTWWELGFGALWLTLGLILTPAQWLVPWEISAANWGWLVVLAVVCTVLPWMWSLRVLKTLTPYAVALATALEPVYAMGFAYVAFPTSERLGLAFYVGTSALVAVIAIHGRLDRPPT